MENRFIQLHLLTFYGPANLNRDDTGRPKTAMIGGTERLRISSQSLKRAIRKSEEFEKQLEGHLAQRTQRLGAYLKDELIKEGIDEENAQSSAIKIAGQFGKIKEGKDEKNPTYTEQLAFISPREKVLALDLARRLAKGEEIDEKKEKALLPRGGAVDIAMFGRMLADTPEFNCEAAVQVAHPFTTHAADVEADYYTAIDDAKLPSEDAGAGFIGTTGYGSGVFYSYICINKALLLENLNGEEGLMKDAISALARGLATVSPTGKQASFASRSRAEYIMAERGNDQPRQLSGAFLKPVTGDDFMAASIDALQVHHDKLEKAYNDGISKPAEIKIMNTKAGTGSLSEIIDFVIQ